MLNSWTVTDSNETCKLTHALLGLKFACHYKTVQTSSLISFSFHAKRSIKRGDISGRQSSTLHLSIEIRLRRLVCNRRRIGRQSLCHSNVCPLPMEYRWRGLGKCVRHTRLRASRPEDRKSTGRPFGICLL